MFCTNKIAPMQLIGELKHCMANSVWLLFVEPFEKRLLMQFSFVKKYFVCRVFCVEHC